MAWSTSSGTCVWNIDGCMHHNVFAIRTYVDAPDLDTACRVGESAVALSLCTACLVLRPTVFFTCRNFGWLLASRAGEESNSLSDSGTDAKASCCKPFTKCTPCTHVQRWLCNPLSCSLGAHVERHGVSCFNKMLPVGLARMPCITQTLLGNDLRTEAFMRIRMR